MELSSVGREMQKIWLLISAEIIMKYTVFLRIEYLPFIHRLDDSSFKKESMHLWTMQDMDSWSLHKGL